VGDRAPPRRRWDGEVHLARDRHQARREVAIKILRAGLADPAAIEGFRGEFRSLARLRHPHLAEVFDFGRSRTRVCRSSPWSTSRGTTSASCRRKEALARFDDLVAQCLRALDYIHERGWLHNDIKPHNIRVTPAFQVKLLDFGLAQRLAAGSEAGASGTLQYLAPERLAGRRPMRARTSTRSASSSTRCSPAAVPTTRRPRAAW